MLYTISAKGPFSQSRSHTFAERYIHVIVHQRIAQLYIHVHVYTQAEISGSYHTGGEEGGRIDAQFMQGHKEKLGGKLRSFPP